MNKSFCLPEAQSPTFSNIGKYLRELGWSATRFKWLASFSEKNFQFNLAAAESLEFKHLLAQLVARYCPELCQ